MIVDLGLDQYQHAVVDNNVAELTPGLSAHLLMLDEQDGRPMGWLAAQFSIDASTVTWIVDQLEGRGLVERRPMPGDRRVKNVALTPLGVRTKARLEEMLYEVPPELLRLDSSVLTAVHEALSAIYGRASSPLTHRHAKASSTAVNGKRHLRASAGRRGVATDSVE